MLIKEAEDPSQVIAALETRAEKPGAARSGAAANLAKRKAGFKGEAESTYLIKFDLATRRTGPCCTTCGWSTAAAQRRSTTS